MEGINRADHHVLLENERHVWFKSADNPDSLRSEGLDWLWVDEGAQIKEDAWDLALRPALIDRKGIAWFTGTPKGHNWYWKLFMRGQDKLQTDYISWNFPSHSNPYLDPKEMEDFARDMPKRAYQQEILGMFLEDVGSVFRGVKTCIKGNLEPYTEAKRYVMGGDLAKYQDFTVLSVLDENGHLCAHDRFGELDWVFQRRRIVNLAQKYHCRLLIDSTGLGDPIYDELKRETIRVEGYKFTSASKKDLIENLSIMIENKQVSYPEIPELINELELFGFTRTKGGTIQYAAPEGYYDDCVISLALAAWQLRKPKGFFI